MLGVRVVHRNPSWLIRPATYGVTNGPPQVGHSQGLVMHTALILNKDS